MFVRGNGFIYFVFFIAVLIGIAFSMRWLYPLYVQANSNGKYSFVPVRYGPKTGAHDGYFYYSHIREIIDGNLISMDPCTYENKDKYPIHSTYAFSLLMCAIGGVLTKNTEHAYYFNYFVYPIINFLLIYLFFYLLTKTKYLSVLLAMFAMIFTNHYLIYYQFDDSFSFLKSHFVNSIFGEVNAFKFSQFGRTPNILFTNIQLFSLIVLLFYKIKKYKKSLSLDIAIIFALGISSLTSIANCFFSYGIYSVLMVLYLKQKEIGFRLLKCFFIALIISVPGIFLITHTAGTINDHPIYASGGTAVFRNFNNFGRFIEHLKTLMLPVLPLVIFRFENKKFIFGILGGIFGVFILFYFLRGESAATYLMLRGGGVPFIATGLSGFVILIHEIVMKKRVELVGFHNKSLSFNIWGVSIFQKKIFQKHFMASLITISLLFVLVCVGNQYEIIKQKAAYYTDPDFKELYKWSMESVTNRDVAMTLDFDLLTNLSVYSPLNVYVPSVFLSPASHAERYERFHQTLKFYGLTPDDYKRLLYQMVSPHLIQSLNPEKDLYRIRLGLMQMVLFPTKGKDKFSNDEVKDMIKKYTNIYNDKNFKLKYKANYLIISEFDESLIRDGSMAAKIVNNLSPVFKNNSYKVYNIKPEVTQGRIHPRSQMTSSLNERLRSKQPTGFSR